MGCDEGVAVGWRFDANPAAFLLHFFESGAFGHPADDAIVFAGAAAEIQLGRSDGLIGVKELRIDPGGRATWQSDLGPFGGFIGFGMFDGDFLDDLDVVASFEPRDDFAVDRSLSTHVDIFLGDDRRSGRKRFSLAIAGGVFFGRLAGVLFRRFGAGFLCRFRSRFGSRRGVRWVWRCSGWGSVLRKSAGAKTRECQRKG